MHFYFVLQFTCDKDSHVVKLFPHGANFPTREDEHTRFTIIIIYAFGTAQDKLACYQSEALLNKHKEVYIRIQQSKYIWNIRESICLRAGA